LLRKVKGKDGVGLSDCEELVGDKFLNRFMTDYFTQKFHSVLD